MGPGEEAKGRVHIGCLATDIEAELLGRRTQPINRGAGSGYRHARVVRGKNQPIRSGTDRREQEAKRALE